MFKEFKAFIWNSQWTWIPISNHNWSFPLLGFQFIMSKGQSSTPKVSLVMNIYEKQILYFYNFIGYTIVSPWQHFTSLFFYVYPSSNFLLNVMCLLQVIWFGSWKFCDSPFLSLLCKGFLSALMQHVKTKLSSSSTS